MIFRSDNSRQQLAKCAQGVCSLAVRPCGGELMYVRKVA